MAKFPEAVQTNGFPTSVTAAVRVQPKYDTLECMMECLEKAKGQVTKLAERAAKHMTAKGVELKPLDRIRVETTEHFLFVFQGSPVADERLDFKDLDALLNSGRMRGLYEYAKNDFFEGR